MKEKYGHRDYTSGKVHSKFYQKYGKIEVRAKVPGGRGIWPAIWMMPQFDVYGGWPASGEIDIWEGRGQVKLRGTPPEFQILMTGPSKAYLDSPCFEDHFDV